MKKQMYTKINFNDVIQIWWY